MKLGFALVLSLGLCCLAISRTSAAGDDFKLEEGFTSLFNGKNFTGWRYYKELLDTKTETADKRFTVESGVIVAHVGTGIKDLFTVKDFPGNFHLKLEFRASLKSDSGVYVRSSGHQLQVRDYIRRGERKQLKKFKNDDWNELDVILTMAVAKCYCNGEYLEDLPVATKSGGIGLQAEDGKFEFRRIRIKELP
ncbi:MAG: DUF1080 domain-containing protein [Planctomycetes bacterium]|nr:DUF1080 domain-containing protein [Planctomycetota bacterium]